MRDGLRWTQRWIRKLAPFVAVVTFVRFGFVMPTLPFFGPPVRVPSLGDLPRQNPPTTAMILLRTRQAAKTGKPFHPRQQWVPLSQVAPSLQNAVIAAEDSTFYLHRGVEWGLTRGAFWETLRTGRRDRGASTLTQQVVRNLYLSPRKTFSRKIREIVLAQRMERTLSKKRILEIYLNVAEWGDGVFGAEAAAQTHFGKSAAELNGDEAVALAAVLPSPRRHRPTDHSPWVLHRKAWVISRLLQTGRLPPPSPTTSPPETRP